MQLFCGEYRFNIANSLYLILCEKKTEGKTTTTSTKPANFNNSDMHFRMRNNITNSQTPHKQPIFAESATKKAGLEALWQKKC